MGQAIARSACRLLAGLAQATPGVSARCQQGISEAKDSRTEEIGMADNDRGASKEELERFRRAAEDALQQLDWAIGYLHGIHKKDEAPVVARNRSYIRRQLLRQTEEPTPELQQG
jgi:hypothetical protein